MLEAEMTATTSSRAPKARQIAASFPEGRPRLKLDLAQPCVAIAAGGHFALLSGNATMDSDFAGYYVHETRMLDELTIFVDNKSLRLRTFKADVFKARYVYTNAAQTLMVERDVVINDGMAERLVLTAFSDVADIGTQAFKLTVHYGSDFRAMGEIRDFGATGRGNMLVAVIRQRSVRFAWDGEDALRTTTVRFGQKPDALSTERAEFTVRLAPGQSTQLEYAVGCSVGKKNYRGPRSYASALASASHKYERFMRRAPSVETGSAEVNRAMRESLNGIYMLVYQANKGQCMAAGLPWYFCLFGRDI
jgi:hypothetical protein